MSISFFAPVEANFTDNTIGNSSAFTPTETPSVPGLGDQYVPRHTAIVGTLPKPNTYVSRHAAGNTMCEAARTDVSHTCPL